MKRTRYSKSCSGKFRVSSGGTDEKQRCGELRTASTMFWKVPISGPAASSSACSSAPMLSNTWVGR